MGTLAERLREERGRLGLNQDAMAAAAGMKRSAQIRYEKGERSPDAEYLSAIAELGVAIAYVVTGRQPEYIPEGYLQLPRIEGFGPIDLPDAVLLPDFIVRHKIGLTPLENVRWVLNPSPAMEPEIEQNALVFIDVSRAGHASVIDGVTYAYTLAGRPDVRRILIRKDHWSVAGVGKATDYRDVYLSDLPGLHVMGTVIGAL
jgi:transcriptional regulator with XRE-family HTH domain